MIIFYMYLTFSLSSVQEYFGKPIRVSLCIPGLEVPEWFCYKNTEGPSLNIPAQWHRTANTDQFLGFTFCAVVSFGHSKKKRPVNIRCECHLITQGGNQSDLNFYCYEGVERKERSLWERDHVFIWSINSNCFFKEASFHFKPLWGTADVVVKCGVHPLFVQDCWWILCYSKNVHGVHVHVFKEPPCLHLCFFGWNCTGDVSRFVFGLCELAFKKKQQGK